MASKKIKLRRIKVDMSEKGLLAATSGKFRFVNLGVDVRKHVSMSLYGSAGEDIGKEEFDLQPGYAFEYDATPDNVKVIEWHIRLTHSDGIRRILPKYVALPQHYFSGASLAVFRISRTIEEWMFIPKYEEL